MYICVAIPICLVLERHAVLLAAAFACEKTGNSIAAKIAIIAITTNSSIRVNAFDFINNSLTDTRQSPARSAGILADMTRSCVLAVLAISVPSYAQQPRIGLKPPKL